MCLELYLVFSTPGTAKAGCNRESNIQIVNSLVKNENDLGRHHSLSCLQEHIHVLILQGRNYDSGKISIV